MISKFSWYPKKLFNIARGKNLIFLLNILIKKIDFFLPLPLPTTNYEQTNQPKEHYEVSYYALLS